MMTLAQTVRIGARRLLKTPLFTIAVLVTLTLGIAANVIVFSAVNGVLLRPLPISRPGDVVAIAETPLGNREGSKEVSYRDYLDWRDQSRSEHRVAYVVRTTGDPLATGEISHRRGARCGALRHHRPREHVGQPGDRRVPPIRFTMALLVALAVLGTVVAAGGLYALTAYSVSQSTPDLAVRMAMGASSGAIIRMMLWQTGQFGVAGLLIGLFLSMILLTRISPLSFGVPALDGLAFSATAVMLGAMICLATYLPARRVTRIEPSLAMRAT